MKRFCLAALALLALFLPAPAAAAVPLSYSIDSDLTLGSADLTCDCVIQIFVQPGANVVIDLPAHGAIKWNPVIMIGTAGGGAPMSTFTVKVDGVTFLGGFTTRTALGHNSAAERWARLGL